VFELESSNLRLAKSEDKGVRQLTDDHFEDKRNAEIGLYGRTLFSEEKGKKNIEREFAG